MCVKVRTLGEVRAMQAIHITPGLPGVFSLPRQAGVYIGVALAFVLLAGGAAKGQDGPSPLRLADAIHQSLASVETVQANVAVQTATVARFGTLKSFVPPSNLPRLAVGFRQLSGPGNILIFPDVTLGALLQGRPLLWQAALNRFNLFFPLDPSGVRKAEA
jgi:hypothetical protein